MENELVPRFSVLHSIANASKVHVWLCITMLILGCGHLSNAQVRSARAGNWSDPATWVGNVVPQATSNVELVDGHQVTITGQVSCAAIQLFPPHNSNRIEKTELVVASGGSLTATSLKLNPKNDRRYTSLVNDGGTIRLASLEINNGCVTENLSGNISVSGALFNIGQLVTNTATLELGGTYNDNFGTGIFTKGTGTVKYTGTAAAGQNIAPLAYHHLQLSGGNVKSSDGALSLSGNLQIEPGTTLATGTYNHSITGDILNKGVLTSEVAQPTSLTIGGDMVNIGTTIAGAATYYVAGDWNNSGSFQAGTSTIVLQGNRLQHISGSNTFYNLVFSGTAQAQLQQDISVTKGISISNSHLNTGANTVRLGESAAFTTLETDAAHIIGSVQTTRTLTAATPENFGNIGLTLTRNEVNPGLITVERVTGVTTEIVDGTQSVTRQYYISRSGTNDISDLSMTMDLTFLPNELKSRPLNEYKLYNKGQNREPLQVPSTAMTQTTMRHTNSNRFGIFTLGPQPTPLPVELIWFKAGWQERVVVLEWKTASEQDNKGFEIQVSADGRTYTPVGFVASKSPDSRVAQLYRYSYANLSRGHVLYFRLKQVDYSGKISYSKAQAVKAPATPEVLEAFPNPFIDKIQFASDATVMRVTLTDLNGRTVLQQQLGIQDLNERGYYTFSTSQLKSNVIYLLTVHTPEKVYKSKLLKQ